MVLVAIWQLRTNLCRDWFFSLPHQLLDVLRYSAAGKRYMLYATSYDVPEGEKGNRKMNVFYRYRIITI